MVRTTNEHPIRSLAEVAAILGVTRGTVQNIEQKALAKLRRHPLMQKLANELLDYDQETP